MKPSTFDRRRDEELRVRLFNRAPDLIVRVEPENRDKVSFLTVPRPATPQLARSLLASDA